MHTGAGESFCFPQPNVDNGLIMVYIIKSRFKKKYCSSAGTSLIFYTKSSNQTKYLQPVVYLHTAPFRYSVSLAPSSG